MNPRDRPGSIAIRESAGDESPFSPPEPVVFPALVFGLGVHGHAVVERLHRRLRGEDPNLLAVIRLALLSATPEGLELREVDARNGAEHVKRYGVRVATDALASSQSSLFRDLQVVCDTLAIHEQLQTLRERGYKTYDEDCDVRIRTYLVGDLHEDLTRTTLLPLAHALQAMLEGRGSLTSTCLCVEIDGEPGADGKGTSSDLACLEGAFDALYVTSRVKHRGFLAANHQELEVAHSLFLESVVLSPVEALMAERLHDVTGVSTFGIAAVRLGIDEMVGWIREALALAVIQRVYLGAEVADDADVGADLEQWRAQWQHGIRQLSMPQLSVRYEDTLPHVGLPETSTLRTWVTAVVHGRLSSPPLSLAETLDKELMSMPSPLPDILVSLDTGIEGMKTDTLKSMREWLTQRLMQPEPGAMPRVIRMLEAWRRGLRREEDLYTEGVMPSSPSTRESDTLVWLHEAIEHVVFQVRRHRARHPAGLAIFTRLAILGILLGTFLRSVGAAPNQIMVASVLPLLVIGLPWVFVTEYRRRHYEQRLLRELGHRLERHLEGRLRTRLLDVLQSLLQWTDDSAGAAGLLLAHLETIAARYEESHEGTLPSPHSHFLEQVRVDEELCGRIVEEVRQDGLEGDKMIRLLPLRLIAPPWSTAASTPATYTGPVLPEIESRLREAVERFAQARIRELRTQSLETLATALTREEEIRDEDVFDEALTILHERALPLRRVPAVMQETQEQQAAVGQSGNIRRFQPPASEPRWMTMCLIPPSARNWREAAERTIGGSVPAHLVDHADNEAILYLRTVHGLPERQEG